MPPRPTPNGSYLKSFEKGNFSFQKAMRHLALPFLKFKLLRVLHLALLRPGRIRAPIRGSCLSLERYLSLSRERVERDDTFGWMDGRFPYGSTPFEREDNGMSPQTHDDTRIMQEIVLEFMFM